MLGKMLRFLDNFKNYYDRRFFIVGAVLLTPIAQVGCGCPTLTQLLGFTFINPSSKLSSYHLHTTFLGVSHLEQLHMGPALFLRATHKVTDTAHMGTLRCYLAINPLVVSLDRYPRLAHSDARPCCTRARFVTRCPIRESNSGFHKAGVACLS